MQREQEVRGAQEGRACRRAGRRSRRSRREGGGRILPGPGTHCLISRAHRAAGGGRPDSYHPGREEALD
jgi:hypothetical protein